MSDAGFLQRWARRKAHAGSGQAPKDPERANSQEQSAPARPPVVPQAPAERPVSTALGQSPAMDAPTVPDAAAPAGVQPLAGEIEPLPSLDSLTPKDDFSPFMRVGVEAGTRNAALRTLFSDPHFNVMDGLDIYIDDYSKPDPMPASMLRKLRQARTLGLVDDDEEQVADAAAADAAAAAVPPGPPVTEAQPAAESTQAAAPQSSGLGEESLPMEPTAPAAQALEPANQPDSGAGRDSSPVVQGEPPPRQAG